MKIPSFRLIDAEDCIIVMASAPQEGLDPVDILTECTDNTLYLSYDDDLLQLRVPVSLWFDGTELISVQKNGDMSVVSVRCPKMKYGERIPEEALAVLSLFSPDYEAHSARPGCPRGNEENDPLLSVRSLLNTDFPSQPLIDVTGTCSEGRELLRIGCLTVTIPEISEGDGRAASLAEMLSSITIAGDNSRVQQAAEQLRQCKSCGFLLGRTTLLHNAQSPCAMVKEYNQPGMHLPLEEPGQPRFRFRQCEENRTFWENGGSDAEAETEWLEAALGIDVDSLALRMAAEADKDCNALQNMALPMDDILQRGHEIVAAVKSGRFPGTPIRNGAWIESAAAASLIEVLGALCYSQIAVEAENALVSDDMGTPDHDQTTLSSWPATVWTTMVLATSLSHLDCPPGICAAVGSFLRRCAIYPFAPSYDLGKHAMRLTARILELPTARRTVQWLLGLFSTLLRESLEEDVGETINRLVVYDLLAFCSVSVVDALNKYSRDIQSSLAVITYESLGFASDFEEDSQLSTVGEPSTE